MLKPQDIFVLLWMCAHPGAEWTYASVAAALRLSSSEVHAALQRAEMAGLYAAQERRPVRAALREFLVHGIRYAFAPRRLGFTRGVPTSYAAPGLSGRILAGKGEPPPVWPHPEGEVRGEGIEPLYRSVPDAARSDERLYQLLALVDALRIGHARERRVAQQLLEGELSREAD